MPHFHVEYSGNLEDKIDMGGLCECIRATAAEIDTFPMPGIRVRATRVDHYAIADGNPAHGFVDISIRLRAGRSEDVKQDATRRVFDAVKAYLAPALSQNSIALSLEMRDIDPKLSPKTGTIRDHLAATTQET
ncbi:MULTISPECIES: 5-carboxymethyl-2-hydroxymuconate Delta-isomerase [unclassified Ruegeria]|uniref:5-carboxymethyl-2-hydroxymuconate Delta-isomerase n=1 Tax=unclassified Ruegeria TaxID=2625375 RepID=UPI0014895F51|nr:MULTISPECIES: 5-carboxymethyl-2-hydroxymuconate Delta-isomerase [unclassified Ruegeria]NOD77824.1 5-carboxymethyl-2-hydroxymuconate isomerase [Ruegeria sp. HKCCD4332]NOD88055.1 5-carboxymethyl-2-hydroxymuconate isomerase [Ruegeria sp. HKCCD4318]NOE14903.1 5-carboxymethyl-2-hydroxymuconate isomerase [Ruegeria sp. HKCCD4318-2]NOG11494.1 5-carboxymethyl-2-hydroxymuconate Delta-isomerase [Ruegeria sp. HKCCD4315]